MKNHPIVKHTAGKLEYRQESFDQPSSVWSSADIWDFNFHNSKETQFLPLLAENYEDQNTVNSVSTTKLKKDVLSKRTLLCLMAKLFSSPIDISCSLKIYCPSRSLKISLLHECYLSGTLFFLIKDIKLVRLCPCEICKYISFRISPQKFHVNVENKYFINKESDMLSLQLFIAKMEINNPRHDIPEKQIVTERFFLP